MVGRFWFWWPTMLDNYVQVWIKTKNGMEPFQKIWFQTDPENAKSVAKEVCQKLVNYETLITITTTQPLN